jgi:hypothetical protein
MEDLEGSGLVTEAGRPEVSTASERHFKRESPLLSFEWWSEEAALLKITM